jgi:phosphatidylserine/phosphatidylglycerophosphate/cardiolipin synthase-like enzyme
LKNLVESLTYARIKTQRGSRNLRAREKSGKFTFILIPYYSITKNYKVEEEMRQAIDNYLDLLKIGVKEVPK